MAQYMKNKMRDLYQQGYTYDEIALQLRCAKSTISYHCNDLTKKETRFTEDKIKEYQEYYNKCLSLKETGEYFNIDRHTLSKYLEIKRYSKVEKREQRIVKKKEYRVNVKKKSVEYKGGKCIICGYNKHYSALDFHHRNPKDKDFQISGGTKSFENLKKELDKCDLLCKNCHAEVHSKLYTGIYPHADTV